MLPYEMALFMMFGFIVKHTVMDFFVQNRVPWMWMNKGKFMHPGGLVHAGTHALGTWGLLAPFATYLQLNQEGYFLWERLLWTTLTFEFIVHYFTDYFKMKICAWRGWKSNTSSYFWDMLGLDQFIHLMTYWVIIYTWVGLAVRV